MTWFEAITGFRETSPEAVRAHLRVDEETLISDVNGKTYRCGRLETPSLATLRQRVAASLPSGAPPNGQLTVQEVVADVSDLHGDPANAGALFQVASQFNLLEMTSPEVTPEAGVTIYAYDYTQGPTCAIAAGAGTIYRNYFARVDRQIGQSAHAQIDCLADLGTALGNQHQRLWTMQNGYALATRSGLVEIQQRLAIASEAERDALRQCLQIGLQWNTQVTLPGTHHTVTQAYCSALPVAYGDHPTPLWESFARLVLEASYEATLCAAILNALNTGNRQVFLTLVGGGVFGNELHWITDSIKRALHCYQNWDLAVAIVSYQTSKPAVQRLIETYPLS